ncbi:hypothetical protein ACM92B_002499 [Cronobacter dublinensis]
MSTISKERLEEKRAAALLLTEYKHEDVRLAAQENVQVIDELLALRKEREAAVPVATAHRLVDKLTGSVHEWKFTPGVVSASEGDKFLVETMPLYAAQPVAVPDVCAEITVLERQRDELLAALEDIIAYNVQYATDKYGDASKAEAMACVRRCREAIARAKGGAAPPAQVHVDQIAEQDRIASDIAGAYMQGCRDTEARLAAAPGKQQLTVETLSNVIRNAPLAPSDSQGRQRDLDSPEPPAPDGNHWYLVSWCGPRGRFGCTEVSFDNPWVLGSMRGVQEIVAEANDLDSRTVVILSVFPIATAPGKEG